MFKVGDTIKVHDRKMKTHTFEGVVIGVEETAEKKRIYTVELDVLNIKNKKTGQKKVLSLLGDQIERIYKPTKKEEDVQL
ncbi:MAG: hypothetical protein KAR20_04150 [Candidatus Heimdallarchaeota archaeon]|nr:hypothetical protein [Candidatus Heimdallarchaeota archaeon]